MGWLDCEDPGNKKIGPLPPASGWTVYQGKAQITTDSPPVPGNSSDPVIFTVGVPDMFPEGNQLEESDDETMARTGQAKK
jgi:hypothetical protein